MSEPDSGPGTAPQLLLAWGAGDRQALDQMLPLVREAYLGLINQHNVGWTRARPRSSNAIEGTGCEP